MIQWSRTRVPCGRTGARSFSTEPHRQMSPADQWRGMDTGPRDIRPPRPTRAHCMQPVQMEIFRLSLYCYCTNPLNIHPVVLEIDCLHVHRDDLLMEMTSLHFQKAPCKYFIKPGPCVPLAAMDPHGNSLCLALNFIRISFQMQYILNIFGL